VVTISDLLQRQDELQAEAEVVSADLELDGLLPAVGNPRLVGSTALGLMVRPDLDITVVCPELGYAAAELVAQIGARLAMHPRVWRVLFRNDTGEWNTDPAYPDGLYLGLGYRSEPGQDWNLDIWFVDEPDRQPDLAAADAIAARLTPDARIAILEIKQALVDEPPVRRVPSYYVYTAVLDDGVQTPEQFSEWLARSARGLASG
jgi:hypothetical protein